MEKEKYKDDVELEEKALLAKPEIDLDKILIEEVGQFGRYQLKAMVLTVVMITLFACQATEYVFTAARVKTRCLIPECENKTAGTEFTPAWLSLAIPTNDDGAAFEGCSRFATNEDIPIRESNEFCSADSFNRNITVPCDEYVYENSNTVVSHFGLACDEWRRSMIGSARTLGSFLAQPIFGYISDRFGRRTAFAVAVLNAAWLGLTRYWITSYVGYLIATSTEATFGFGTYPCLYILMMETVGPKYRVLVGAIMCTSIAMGGIVLGFIAWAVPNWKTLTLIIYVPQLLSISAYWCFSESVRWYFSKGKIEDAEKVLKYISRINGTQLSEKTLLALHQSAANKKKDKEQNENTNTSEPWLFVQIWRYKPILLRCLITPVWWLTFTFVYYGLTINSVNLSIGNKYTNFLTVSMFEIPGFWASMLLVNRIGRKLTLAGAFWVCALAITGFMFIPLDYPKVSLAFYILAKCSISSVGTSVYLYTSELFPTKCRHTLVAFCSMMGRIGSILAPMTPAFGGRLPFVLFASLGVVAGLLVLAAPETRGCRLPDSMEEAADIGAQRTHGKGG